MSWDTFLDIGMYILGAFIFYHLYVVLGGVSDYVRGWGMDRLNRAKRNEIRHGRWVNRQRRTSLDMNREDLMEN